MSSLHGKLEEYLAVRRAMGFKMERHEKLLGQFAGFITGNGETVVTIENAIAWATQPVFCVDQLANACGLLGGQNTNCCREFGAGSLSADGAGSDLDLRVVTDALILSQLAAGHEVEFVIVFGKPNE